MATATGPVLSFRNLSLGYERRPVLVGLDGEVGAGELLAIIGPNGAGKSTLLKGVVGEADILAGQLLLGHTDVRAVAYLPQRSEIDVSFPITVSELAGTGLWRRLGPFGRMRLSERRMIADAIGRVGLSGLERRLIGGLSGGQMQRVLFARTILQEAQVILLDEPFTSIDSDTTADLLDIVREWHREGRTVLAALHDLRQVREVFPRSLLLAGRPVAWGRTDEVVTPANLDRARHADGWGLPEAQTPTAARARTAPAA